MGNHMATTTVTRDLTSHGIRTTKPVHWNQSAPELFEQAIMRGEGKVSRDGAFVANTTPHTGRSPNDKFVVREPSSESNIAWGPNAPLALEKYEILKRDVLAYLSAQELFARDLLAGA